MHSKLHNIRKFLEKQYRIDRLRYLAMSLEEKRNLLIDLRKHSNAPLHKIETTLEKTFRGI